MPLRENVVPFEGSRAGPSSVFRSASLSSPVLFCHACPATVVVQPERSFFVRGAQSAVAEDLVALSVLTSTSMLRLRSIINVLGILRNASSGVITFPTSSTIRDEETGVSPRTPPLYDVNLSFGLGLCK